MTCFPRSFDELGSNDMDDVPIIAGGIIPESDRSALESLGVRAIYGPGTTTTQIIECVRQVASERESSHG